MISDFFSTTHKLLVPWIPKKKTCFDGEDDNVFCNDDNGGSWVSLELPLVKITD